MLVYSVPKRHVRVVKAMRDPRHSRILQTLEAFLKLEEPVIIQWLRSLWENQQNAVTYGELRDAILDGVLTIDYLKQWQEDYAKLVAEKIAPKWRDAMAEGAKAQVDAPGFEFDVTTPAVEQWIDDNGAKLVTRISSAQQEGLKAVIHQAAAGTYGPDELARVIRPMVGATARQTKAAERYYEGLRKDGVRADEAKKRALNMIANAHRYRAQNIARTELAQAFNAGADLAVRQAQSQGYMGEVDKVWLTADDERVCDVCGPLDEVRVAQDATFPGGFAHPTAHPQCRCCVAYEEVDR
ncbi:hypothetical protein AAC03nite_20250 [Alicyclobacillus acidoterrestris]|nr:hypothetical protein AAC03nite_20250 [Alicyclobacillus acidoterrestris]